MGLLIYDIRKSSNFCHHLQNNQFKNADSTYTIQPRTRGCGGLVVRSRFRDWRVPGSKPDSTEPPPCMRATLHHTQGANRPHAGVVRKLEEGGSRSGVIIVI
ncbi:hypothetical protein AVEN_18817-1 [Araneus ventricosus]|uniref:Uncharacterized protein n=1 Tax=Araneus ventricosus TaxID=182803 RepID=A0A4Y2PV96_ARAVE|nr:hypothetical protein AVEN_18817-1 [Araneus ventricosus]